MSRLVSLGNQLIREVRMNNVKDAEELIIQGADVNYEDDFGTMPIFIAIQYKLYDMAEMLINHGADVNIDHGVTPLINAIDVGSIRMVELLINRGANINYMDHSGITPLTWALYIKSDKIAEILIKRGADVNHANFKGETPLMIACNNGNENLIDLLIINGANIDAKNMDGNTAFDLLKAKHRTIYDKIRNKYNFLIANGELWNLTQGYIEAKTQQVLGQYMDVPNIKSKKNKIKTEGGRRRTKRRKSAKRRSQRKQ